MKVLHRFNHGIGDAMQFTAVLNHLTQWENHVAALLGKHTAFANGYILGYEPRKGWDQQYSHRWPECFNTHTDSPGTKTVECLRTIFKIAPQWDKLRYNVSVDEEVQEEACQFLSLLPNPAVLIHYEGNTSQDNKNLEHKDIKRLCLFLLDQHYTPVILDWDNRSPLPDNRKIFRYGKGVGDVQAIAGLINGAKLFVGIDSGPQKIAFATNTPCLAVWTKHHPYHYADNAPNAIHLVREDTKMRGDKGVKFFEEHYRYSIYTDLIVSLVGYASAMLERERNFSEQLES